MINETLLVFKNIVHAMPICWFQLYQHFFILKTIMYDPSSFDVPVFNFPNVSRNVSCKVSSWKSNFGKSNLYET